MGQAIRNVALVGPGGAGKTTLAEAILLATATVNRLGSVADGTTVCDHDEVEKRIGRSVSLAVAATVSDGIRINLVDTPGHADFVGELRAGLRAADAALFVVSAVDGIDGGTRMLWRECAAVGMPRAVVVTHVDQPRGDFAAVLAACQDGFGTGVQPLYLPADDGALLGLLSGTVQGSGDPVPAELTGDQQAARDALIEAVITESEDESLLEKFLSGEEIGFDTVVADLEKAVAHGSFHPVLPVVPVTGSGVPQLLELLRRGFPEPVEHVLPPVYTPAGAARPALTGDPDGPLVAEVISTTTDPYVGRVSLVRVFSGTLKPEVPVHVSGHFGRFTGLPADGDRHPDHDVDERAGSLSRPVGAGLTQLDRAVAGEIVAVTRLSAAETGDTLSDPSDPAVLPPWNIPEPLLPQGISAKAASDEDKLAQALARVQAEDPTTRVETNPDTEQQVLWTMGELHLQVLLERMRGRAGLAVAIDPVRIPARETVRGNGSGTGRQVKQSGGHGQYAVATVDIEPMPQGGGFEFVDKVVGGAVPRQYIPSVEKGVRGQLRSGVTGHPMVDVRVTLTGGKAHSVDSSDAAFQLAGALALKEAATAAGVQLLEPLDLVSIAVDDDYVGAVLSDLAARRAQVRGTEAAGDGRTEITAEVPQLELVRYAAELRSLAHGTGVYRREYARHAPAPNGAAERLVGH